MSRETDLLATWEAMYGELDERWVELFLEHPALAELARLPRNTAIRAIRQRRRLNDALSYALALKEAGKPGKIGDPRSAGELVALYRQLVGREISLAEETLLKDERIARRLIGFSRGLLVEAARDVKPLDPVAWAVAAETREKRNGRLSAGSVLEGRDARFEHRPSAPGGFYKKGDI
jgi:hypothetical protein